MLLGSLTEHPTHPYLITSNYRYVRMNYYVIVIVLRGSPTPHYAAASRLIALNIKAENFVPGRSFLVKEAASKPNYTPQHDRVNSCRCCNKIALRQSVCRLKAFG